MSAYMRALRAISELEPDCYGVSLRQALGWSTWHVYSVAEDLEMDGLIEHEVKPGDSRRSYRARRFWRTTAAGRKVLEAEA